MNRSLDFNAFLAAFSPKYLSLRVQASLFTSWIVPKIGLGVDGEPELCEALAAFFDRHPEMPVALRRRMLCVPLLVAVSNDYQALVERLLENGAALERVSAPICKYLDPLSLGRKSRLDELTPLWAAATFGAVRAGRVLIEAGRRRRRPWWTFAVSARPRSRWRAVGRRCYLSWRRRCSGRRPHHIARSRPWGCSFLITSPV